MLLLTACTTNLPVPSYKESLQEDYTPIEEETWATEQSNLLHQELLKKGLIDKDPRAVQYLLAIKHRIIASEQSREFINIFLLRSATPNAFALPNGNIYIHSGLFSVLHSEDQLAAIISHEIAHITLRHGIKGILDRKEALMGAHVANILTGGLGLVYLGTAADIMHYSRKQERAADITGFELMVRSGFRPEAFREAFDQIKSHPEMRHLDTSIYSSHPSYEDRIDTIEALISNHQTPPQDTVSDIDQEDTPQTEDNATPFNTLRHESLIDNINIHLRHKQYNTAQLVVDWGEALLAGKGETEFYLGEIYMGLYKHPKLAAREKQWIESGKKSENKHLIQFFRTNRYSNLELAISHFQASIDKPHNNTKAYRRLGEAFASKGDNQKAIEMLRIYLEMNPDSYDRKYIKYRINQLM